MEDPAFWRDLQSQFRALPDSPRARLSASEGDGSWIPSGGPTDRVYRQSLQIQFRALARRGGIATGVVAVAEQAFDAWLNLLRQRSPRFLAVKHESCQDVLTDPRDLPVAEIDSPTPMDSVSEADQDRMIVVDPGTHGRYVLVVGHGAYSAAVANGLQSVSCRIRESTQSLERESGWINDLCLASAELCIELETEAFSQHQVRPLDSSEPSTGSAIKIAGLESELLDTLQGTGKGGRTGSDRREYVFRQAADHLWEVRFAEERQIGVKNLAGMKLIRALLADAGRSYGSVAARRF